MEKAKSDKKEKIILPENLQKEMIKFFLKTSIPKIIEDKERQQPPENSKNEGAENGNRNLC